MDNNDKIYGFCGVYCGQCPSGKGTIESKAKELRELIINDYNWVESVVEEFDYVNFLKGLEWFTKQKCPTCTKIKEPWYDVRKCDMIINQEIKSCLLCNEFLICPKTKYQREWYPFVKSHLNRVKKLGSKSI